MRQNGNERELGPADAALDLDALRSELTEALYGVRWADGEPYIKLAAVHMATVVSAVLPVIESFLASRSGPQPRLRALAEKWALWKPSGWTPGPLYGAGQYATAQGCAQEIFDLLGLPMPADESAALMAFDFDPSNVNNVRVKEN